MEDNKIEAVLVTLSISMWSGQRTDEAVSAEVAAMKQASHKAGRYVKNLIDPAALKAVRGAATALRAKHHELTRAWEDGGRRLLTGKMIDQYNSEIQQLKDLFIQEADTFRTDFDSQVKAAQESLGDMFNPSDYPSDVFGHFDVFTSFEPLPAGAALPMTLKDREALSEEINRSTDKRLKDSATALFHRTVHSIRTMRDRLQAYHEKAESGEGRFYGSMLEEIRRLAELLPKLNVEDDPFLNGIAERLADELANLDPTSLKDNLHSRKGAMTIASDIIEQMENHDV